MGVVEGLKEGVKLTLVPLAPPPSLPSRIDGWLASCNLDIVAAFSASIESFAMFERGFWRNRLSMWDTG